MTQTTAGTLWIVEDDGSCNEILNDERARHYQLLNPLWRGNNCVECGCDILNFDLCTDAPLTYGAAPDDGTHPAPWYSSDTPASADFLGFLVSDVDGLDYSMLNRSVNQRGGDGANASPMRASGREITFTMLATANTEEAMRYGLDWLAMQLMTLGRRCSAGRMLMRLFCPEYNSGGTYDFSDGKVELRDVALDSGPVWTTNFLDGAGCKIRELRFTLIVTDPCFYTFTTPCSTSGTVSLPQVDLAIICGGTVTVAQLLCGPINSDALPLDATSPRCEIEPGRFLESRAATVSIQMMSGTTGPFLIEAYHGTPGTAAATVVATPGAFLGRIGVVTLTYPEGALVDAVTGTVFSRPTSGDAWVPDDSLLLFPDEEFPYFPRYAGVDSLYVTVRPYYVCSGSGTFVVEIDETSVFGCMVD